MANIIVCGKFHYPLYISESYRLGLLDRFYFSYKFGSNFGLPRTALVNRALKEYLTQLHLRTLGKFAFDEMVGIYHSLWEDSIARVFIPARINHFMVHGTSLKLMRHCKKSGAIVIGEAVNAHPLHQTEILAAEAERRKLTYQRNERLQERMLAEVSEIDFLVVPSHFLRNSYLRAGFASDQVAVLNYGVPIIGEIQRQPHRRPIASVVRVLCVGAVIMRKGQYYLLEAVKRFNMRHEDIKLELTLVGNPDLDYLQALNELDALFKHINHVPNSQMLAFMSKHDIFVLPSLEDGFGVVIAEALSAGLPVITTTNCGGADLISHGTNGLVIPAADSAAIYDAIVRVLDENLLGNSEPPLRSWQRYARDLGRVYSEIEVRLGRQASDRHVKDIIQT